MTRTAEGTATGRAAHCLTMCAAVGLGVCAVRCAPARGPRETAADVLVPAGVVLEATTRTYDVSGTSVRTLAHDLFQASLREFGRYRYAEHRGRFAWRYTVRQDLGGCGVKTATVTTTSAIVLPRWVPADSAAADSAVRSAWARFANAVAAHELGHRSISLRYAGEVWQALRFAHAASCPALGSQVDAAAQTWLAREQEAQRAYDVATTRQLDREDVWPPRMGRAPAPDAAAETTHVATPVPP